MTEHAGSGDQGGPRPALVRGAFPKPEKRGSLAILVSAFLHILAIWGLVGLATAAADPEVVGELFSFMMPQATPGGGGGGGVGGPTKLSTPPPPPPEQQPKVIPPPPPVPVAVPDVIPPVTAPVSEAPPPTQAVAASTGTGSSGTGGGRGGGDGTGNGPGRGSGDGPGSGTGRGGGDGEGARGTDPTTEQLIIPQIDKTPKEYKGKDLEVTFYVDERGRVTRVTTNPPITDKSFARRFEEAMRDYTFKPGTDSTGRIVAKSTKIIVTFQ